MGDTYDLIDSGYYPNTAPTLAISPETSTSADTGLTVAIADLGSDADGDDISLGNLTVTSGDAIVFTDADGALVVIPTGSLAEGDTDTVTIGYSLNDGTDLTSGGALTVTVTGTGSSTLHLTLSQAKGAYAANYTTLSSLGDAFTSITIHATGTEIAALSDTDLAQFKDLGVTLLDASDDAISLTLAQLTAMNTAGIGLSAADAVTLSATATDISALDADDAAMIAAMGVNTITVSSGGAGGGGDVVLDASVAASLADVSGLAITGASSVTITGDGDTIANVYGDDIQALATLGVTAIDVSDNAVAIDIAEAEAYVSAGIAFAADDTVAVSLWSTDLASFGTQKSNEFKDLGVDILNVSGNRATVSLAFAQALAARNIGFSSEDAITITLSASELAALDADDIDDLDDLGADVLDLSDNAGSVTLAQAVLLSAAGIAFAAEDTITLADTGANLAGLTSVGISDLKLLGVSVIDASDNAVDLSFAQLADLKSVLIGLTYSDAVTLSDTAANLSALDTDDAATIAAMGVDAITVSDSGAVSLDAAAALALSAVSGLAVSGAMSVTVTGTGATIAAFDADEMTALGALGVTVIDATDDAATLTLDQAQAIADAGIVFDDGDVVTVALSTTELAALGATDLDALDAVGVDVLDMTGNVATLTLAQAAALTATGIAFASDDVVTIGDTGANLAGLDSATIADLAALGVTTLDATDNAVALSLAQLSALKTAGIGLTPSDVVSLTISAADLSNLGSDDVTLIADFGVDKIALSDTGGVTLPAGVAAQLLTIADLSVTGLGSMTVVGNAALIGGFSAADIAGLAGLGVSGMNVGNDAVTLTLAQAKAYAENEIDFASGDAVTVALTATQAGSLDTDTIDDLGEMGADVFDLVGDAATLTLAQAQAIADAGIVFVDGDVVTIALSATELAALGATDLDALDAVGVDVLDMTGNVATLTLAQAAALAATGIAFASDDTITVADTGANLAGLDSATIADLAALGVATLDAADNAVGLSLAQLSALKTAGIGLTPSDVVSLTISAADMSNLTTGSAMMIADFGVDTIALSDTGVVILNAAVAAQLLTIADLSVTGQGSMAIAGTSAEIAAFDITDINRLAEFGVSRMNVSEDAVTLTFAQSAAYASNEIGFSSGDTVTIALTATEVTSLDTDTIDDVGAWGADAFDVVGDAATLTLDQAKAVANAGIVFDDGDVVTVALSTTELAALGATDLDALDAVGVDVLDMTGNVATLTLAQAAALTATGIAFASDDVVTIGDTGANLAGLDSATIADLAALGVTTLDATDNTVGLSLAQLSALKTAGIGLTPSDVVSLTISAADLSNLGSDDVTLIADFGVDKIALSDTGGVTLPAGVAAQLLTIADLSVTGLGSMTVVGNAALIGGFSAADIAGLAGLGVSGMNVGNDAVTLTLAQAKAYAENEIDFASGDAVTVALTATQAGSLDTDTIDDLGEMGADVFDLVGDAATLTLAQAQAIADAGIVFVDGDVVTIALSATELAALGATDLDALDAVGVDVLDMTGNAATLTLAQAQSVAYRGIAFAETDAITVALSAAELAALDGDDLEDLDEVGANVLDLVDGAGSLTLAQAVRLSAADIAFASGDTITLADTGSRLAGLTSVQIGDLKDLGVATLDASDDAVYLSLAQLADLKSASIGLAAGDVVTLSDDAAALSALDADGAALIADMDVDAIAVSDAVAVSLDAAAALALSTVPGLAVSGAASVTVTGTSDVITDFDEDDISALAAFGVTAIDATDDAVTVTLAQAQAVASAGVAFAGGDVVTATLTLAEAKALESATSDALDAAGVDILRLEAAPADIKALTTTEIAALGAAGVDTVDLDPDRVLLSAAQIAAFADAGVTFSDGDTVVDYAPLQLVADSAKASEHAVATVNVGANDMLTNGFELHVTEAVVSSGDGVVTINDDGTLSVAYAGPDIDGSDKAVVKVTYTATDGEMSSTAELSVTFTATAEDGDDIVGTPKSEKLTGTAAGERIFGLAGNDVIYGLGGNDKLYGDTGADTLFGGAGDDSLFGDEGKDRLVGGEGDDRLVGGADADRLFGDTGNDTLDGGKGEDKVYGGDGHDKLYGGTGADIVSGGAGDDTLTGGAGSDRLSGGAGADTFVFVDEIGSHREVVTDFQASGGAQDVIDLSDFDLASFKALRQLMDQNGDNVVIAFEPGETIVLKNVDIDDLSKSDFLL